MPRAVFVRRPGGAEVLTVEEHDPGPPGPGHVRIRVAASGVNFIDVYLRTGLYPRPVPFVLGLEGAGRVEQVGSGTQRFSVGDRVAWSSVPGSYAGVVLAPEESLLAVPDAVPDEIAAASMLQGMTAHYLAHSTRTTAPGETVLVHAAAGGTGLLLVQLLKRAGATVLGTCSTEAKAKLASEAGCDRVIRYTDEDPAEAARAFTEGRGVDVVYDSVGQATFEASLRSLRPRGLLVLFGQSSGPVPPFDLLRLQAHGSIFVTRPSLVNYTQTREELELRATAILESVARKDLQIRISATYPLDQAAEAHQALEGRRTTGKVLLRP